MNRLLQRTLAVLGAAGAFGCVHGGSTASAQHDPAAVVELVTFLAERGYAYQRTIAQRPGAQIVIATDSVTDKLLLVDNRPSGVRRLQLLLELHGAVPTYVGWRSLGLDTVLQVTLDDRAEGIVGTVLFDTRPDSLIWIFADEAGVCQPSILADRDGDGRTELVSYAEPEFGTHCTDPCSMAIHSQFHMTPTWVVIRRWDGRAWVPAEDVYRFFYGRMEGVYRSMAQWVNESEELMAHGCRVGAWAQGTNPFLEWAERARRLASR
jgi:hypothetical protein